MNTYDLSRDWFDWCFDNTSKISPAHTALFFFIIEHQNRLGWKEEFGLPRQMAMDAIGIRNQRTFTKIFNDLEEWGFIKVLQRSKNQYSANIIALSKKTRATTKALDKARHKHEQKQSPKQNTKHSIGIARINKPYNPITLKPEKGENALAFDVLKIEKTSELETFEMQNKKSVQDWNKMIKAFNNKIELELAQGKIEFEANQLMPRFRGWVDAWIDNQEKFKPKQNENNSTSKIPIG